MKIQTNLLKGFTNFALITAGISAFSSAANAYEFYSPLEKGVISEMKCVKRILEHNVGQDSGFQFTRAQLHETITTYQNNQSLSDIIADCNQFLKSNRDNGFDDSGSQLKNFSASEVSFATRKHSRDHDSPETTILKNLLYPMITCGEFTADGIIAVAEGASLDVRLSACESSNGGIFIRSGIGGGTGLAGLAIAGMVGVGGGGGVATYVQAHEIGSGMRQSVTGGGYILGLGGTQESYSDTTGDDGQKTLDLGLGVGAAKLTGDGGALKIPFTRNSDLVLLRTFKNSLK
jgi:hypothetical protein